MDGTSSEPCCDLPWKAARYPACRQSNWVRAGGGYRLATRQAVCLDIKWVQDLGHHFDECRFQETQDTRVLLKTLMRLWSEAPGLKPLRVGVVLTDLAPQATHQPDLFDQTGDGWSHHGD